MKYIRRNTLRYSSLRGLPYFLFIVLHNYRGQIRMALT
jgi:hypothetical protein